MSAFEKHRKLLKEKVADLKQWAERLDSTMEKRPDDVIEWFQVQQISEAANAIIYEAGMVNGAAMSEMDKPRQRTEDPKP